MTKRNTRTPIVKPEVVFIEDLLDQIGAGKLRVPGFQRPFVWKPRDMLDLFDSIYKGYPIGSLLLWESSEQLESSDYVGPLLLPRAKKKIVAYILDGHQRLTTLYVCLRLSKDWSRGPLQKDWSWWVWFDLLSEQFRHVPKGEPQPHLFPMRSILRTVDFLEEARRMQREVGTDSENLIQTAEGVAQEVKNYKVAVTRIEGGTLGEAVEIFSRLNTKGASMSLDQMVSALTYREGTINLASRIDGILERLAVYRFGNVKRLTIFRAIMAAAGLPIQDSNWEAIAKDLGDTLEAAIDAAEAALVASAKFLAERLSVVSDELLPYTNQLLALSEFFHRCPVPTPQQEKLLEKWFWSTSYSGWFAGANTTDINNAIGEMASVATGAVTSFEIMSLSDPARPFPSSFDMRGARIRALLLVMVKQRPRSFETGELLDSGQIISERGNYAFASIFPSTGDELQSNPANRVLSEHLRGAALRQKIRSLDPSNRQEILASHAIPEEAACALQTEDARTFIQLRASAMANVEREFLASTGLPLPADATGETDIDTDESKE